MVIAKTANLMLTASTGSQEETAVTWQPPRPLSALLLTATAKTFPSLALLGNCGSLLRSAASRRLNCGMARWDVLLLLPSRSLPLLEPQVLAVLPAALRCFAKH